MDAFDYADSEMLGALSSWTDETDDFSDEPGSKRQRTNMTEAEKAQFERERNRLHARNTRARKKQYVEELKARVDELVQQKDEILRERAEKSQKLSDQQARWKQTLRTALNLREQACMDEAKWRAVLVDNFKLTLPVTPYRSFNPADVVNHRRIMIGVEGMINDTASLKVLCDNLGSKSVDEGRTSIEYLLGRDDYMFTGNEGLMCTFIMQTKDAVAHGALMEVEKHGMLRAKFAEDGRLEELDMMWDGIAFYHQLQKAAGVEDFSTVPNTLEAAMKLQKERVVITTAERPFRITHVNDAWTKLCGYELDECKGSTLTILQGEETNMDTVEQLCGQAEKAYPSSMIVTNRSKEGRKFRNHLRCYPLTQGAKNGEITHILGVLEEINAQ
jgi:PAS domain S-box-containing protein